MGTMGDIEGSGEKGSDKASSGEIGVSDPVVYQLVRVQGDGRLVPATDDEVIEVEQLLEDDKIKQSFEEVNNQPSSVEVTKHNEGCISNKALCSKKSEAKGPVQSEDTEDSRKLNARLEFIEVMLQKVKQEERLRLLGESLSSSSKHVDVNSETYVAFSSLNASRDKLQPVNISKETDLSSMIMDGSQSAQVASAETCSESKNQTAYSRSSESETCTSSVPDFSILTGEICLDKLSIRELQEAFRATFGRQTSVKDKLWLKRRIAMGLTNSYDVPTTSFIIKDNKIILQEVKEEASCTPERSKMDVVSLSTGINQIVDQQISGKRLRKTPSEYDMKEENLQIEPHSAKRLRKPTKRYIEELSESETRECSAKVCSSIRSLGLGHSPLKSRIGLGCDVESHGRSFLTRHESVGGFGIQVPYVSRIRRGRPRKNFIALMSFVAKEKQLPSIEKADFQGKSDLEHKRSDATGDSTDDNFDPLHTPKAGVRRKHHRAWTLCEVLKLVEGVARYGAGRWSEIRRLAFASYSYRTSVDLKDKWRNLLRASLAHVHNDKGEKNFRKQASIPIPMPILSRVRELAELHAQTGFELKPSKFTSHGVETVQEKGSGFL